MSRPPGRRNADFETTRREILGRMVQVVARHPEQTSFAELAEVSGVSRTTLRHYFPTRQELIHALLETMRALGDQAGNAFPISDDISLEQALRVALERFAMAWRVGVGSLFVAGLIWGLGDADLGPAFVTNMLEPMLARFEHYLTGRLLDDGQSAADARFAALSLVSPIVLALLHQESLGGSRCRPLNLAAFSESHLQRFLRGWCKTRRPSRAKSARPASTPTTQRKRPRRFR